MSSFDDILRTMLAEQVEPIKSKLEEITKALESKSDSSEDDWIRPGRACRMLGADPKHLVKLVECGLLTPCFLPGSNHRRFIRKEIEALKKKNTLPKY